MHCTSVRDMMANKLQSKTNILNSFSESTHHTIATDNQFYVSLLPPPVPDHKQKGDISLPVPTSSQSSLRRKPCRPAPPPPAANNSNKTGCLSKAQPPCRSPSRVKPCRPAPPPPAAKTSIKTGHSSLPKALTRSSSRIKPCRPAPPPPVSYKSHHASPAQTSFQKHLHQANSVRWHSNQLKQPSTSVLKKRRAISLNTLDKTVLTDDRSSGGERLTLSKLIEKHSQSFPINVQVVQGFYGEYTSIASGEIYTIQSVKHTNVVTLKDHNCQMSFPVPFDSPARFGIVYKREDSSCLEFGSVGELMDTIPLPRVVCAKNSCCDSDDKPLVRENEILAIEGIQKEKCMLKVASVTDQKEKFLQRECMGHFTTDPFCTQMYLSEIMSYVPDPLPLTARMFLSAEGETTFPEYLFSEPVLLTDQYMETFLIASPGDDDDAVPNTVVELPTSLDIEVTVIPPKSTERVKLYAETTENVYAEPNTQACMDRSNLHTYAAVSHFQTSNSESPNTDCSQPELPKYQPLLKSTVKDPGKYINVQIGGTPSSPTTPSHAETLETSPVEKPTLDTSQPSPPLTPPSTSFCKQSETRKSELESLTQAEISVSFLTSNGYSTSAYIDAWRKASILRLLDLLDMKKYQKEFAQEFIDGMILVECDEAVLEHELGVSSKQDRMKLMRIISGQQSALSILKGST